MNRTLKNRKPIPPTRQAKKPGRNQPCHCGSGVKYKHCHEPSERISLQKKIIEQRKEAAKKKS